MTAKRFEDLPEVRDGDDMRRVHNTMALYFVSKTGVAHSDMDCFLAVSDNPEKLIGNSRWRVATDVERRALGIHPCESCC